MITEAWIILLVDRSDLHVLHRAVSRRGWRTRQLRLCMLFGSDKGAEAYIRKRFAEQARKGLRTNLTPPSPWGGRWLPVPVKVRIDTADNVSALLDVHAELN